MFALRDNTVESLLYGFAGALEWNRRQAGNTVLLSLILYFLSYRIDAVITVI